MISFWRLVLVFEMSLAGDDHSHVVFLAVVDAVLVMYRAARVNHAGNACLVGYLDAVGEREEGVACHHGSVEVESE